MWWVVGLYIICVQAKTIDTNIYDCIAVSGLTLSKIAIFGIACYIEYLKYKG